MQTLILTSALLQSLMSVFCLLSWMRTTPSSRWPDVRSASGAVGWIMNSQASETSLLAIMAVVSFLDQCAASHTCPSGLFLESTNSE